MHVFDAVDYSAYDLLGARIYITGGCVGNQVCRFGAITPSRDGVSLLPRVYFGSDYVVLAVSLWRLWLLCVGRC